MQKGLIFKKAGTSGLLYGDKLKRWNKEEKKEVFTENPVFTQEQHGDVTVLREVLCKIFDTPKLDSEPVGYATIGDYDPDLAPAPAKKENNK